MALKTCDRLVTMLSILINTQQYNVNKTLYLIFRTGFREVIWSEAKYGHFNFMMSTIVTKYKHKTTIYFVFI
jgi:hypothetical protein